MTALGTTWWRRAFFALAVLAAALSLAGLRAAAGQSATAPKATASAGATDAIANFKYKPTPLTVRAGTTVTFANRDKVTHTATANGGGFDTGQIKPGKSASVKLKRPGTYLFHCEIHPFMHGKIVVE